MFMRRMELNLMSEILLDESAYIHNLNQIAKKAGGFDKIFLIAKDNSYGHGARLICDVASKLGIKKAVVKSVDEATEIKDLFGEILVLSHIPNGEEELEFTYCINDISNLSKLKKGAKIHIAIDTLMHRNGIMPQQITDAVSLAKQNSLILVGAYTHFRSSDEVSGDYFTQKQNFAIAKEMIKKEALKFGFKDLVFHCQNSAALERSAGLEDDFVRVGIAQFGYAQFDDSLNLKKVLKLYANRVSARELKKGQRVGYGGVYEAPCDMDIATYDLGYGDGLLRYGGKGKLRLANGTPLLGKMSMDNFSCEDFGERVCVFDDANIWAEFFDTISYEILVKLSYKIKRRWI